MNTNGYQKKIRYNTNPFKFKPKGEKRKSSQRFTARSWESGSLNQSGYINAVKKDSVFTDDKEIPVLGLLSTNKDLGGLLYSGTVYTLFKRAQWQGRNWHHLNTKSLVKYKVNNDALFT